MEGVFTGEYKWFWAIALWIALFFPARQLIWVMSVRRHMRKGGVEQVDDAEQDRLKRRAGLTSALLCFFFAVAYTQVLFNK